MAAQRSTRTREATKPYWDKPGPVSFSRAEVNAPMIWNFCEAVEDGNPVYWDEEFAKQTRFGRLIAPPQMIMTMSGGHWWAPRWLREREQAAAESGGDNPQREVMAIVNADGYTTATNVTREDEFLAPYGPGDGRLKQSSRVIDVSEEKQTAVGKGVFITSVIEYRTEVDDRLVVRATNVLLMYDSSEPRER
jgi:acyl dehydratase